MSIWSPIAMCCHMLGVVGSSLGMVQFDCLARPSGCVFKNHNTFLHSLDVFGLACH